MWVQFPPEPFIFCKNFLHACFFFVFFGSSIVLDQNNVGIQSLKENQRHCRISSGMLNTEKEFGEEVRSPKGQSISIEFQRWNENTIHRSKYGE